MQTTLSPPAANSLGQETSSAPSVGLIAGAAVGGTLGLVALTVLGYLFFRRRSKKRQQAGYSVSVPPPHPSSSGVSQQSYVSQDYSQMKGHVELAGYGGYGPVEMNGVNGNRERAELDVVR